MASKLQFDDFGPRKQSSSPHCIACEEMLADALDHTLGVPDQAWFDRHLTTCAECSQMVADAQRGAAWLELLKTPRPEPPAGMLDRILAQTGGQISIQTGAPSISSPPQLRPLTTPFVVPTVGPRAIFPGNVLPANVLAFRPRLPRFAALPHAFFEPRLAMTAAMAFFSVALTLNLTGVQLSQLKPSSLKHNYYEANADAARFYDNLRVVRVLESRVDDLRQANADDSSAQAPTPSTTAPAKAAPAKPEPKKNNPEPSPGQSLRETPAGLRSHDEGGLV